MREASFREVVVPALLCTGVAAALIWAGLTRSAALHVPPYVAYLVAAVLVSAGVALLAKAADRPRVVNWLVVLMLAGFAIVGGWIALHDTAGACRAGLDGYGVAGDAPGCRAAFGLGALVNTALTIWAARLALKASRPT